MTFEMISCGENIELRFADESGVYSRTAWIKKVLFYLTEPNFPADRVFWMCVLHGAPPIIGGAYAAFHPYIVEHEKLVEVARAKLHGMKAL